MGQKLTVAEQIKKNKRMVDRAIRDMDREQRGLEREQKRLENEIKKMAKQQQMVKPLSTRLLPVTLFLRVQFGSWLKIL